MKIRLVMPNKNLRAILKANEDIRARFDQAGDSLNIRILNAWANMYAVNPQKALEVRDRIVQEYENTCVETTEAKTGVCGQAAAQK